MKSPQRKEIKNEGKTKKETEETQDGRKKKGKKELFAHKVQSRHRLESIPLSLPNLCADFPPSSTPGSRGSKRMRFSLAKLHSPVPTSLHYLLLLQCHCVHRKAATTSPRKLDPPAPKQQEGKGKKIGKQRSQNGEIGGCGKEPARAG